MTRRDLVEVLSQPGPFRPPAPRGRRARTIERLRRAYPGTWTYEWPSTWRHESGREVVGCSELAPRYDGDDDSFRSTLRWSDTGEVVWI